MLMLMAIAATVSAGDTVPRTPKHDTVVVVSAETTYFVTNRGTRDVRDVRRAIATGDSLEYGFVVTRYRERAGPGTASRWVGGFEAKQADSVQLSRGDFLARIAAADTVAATRGEGPVLYVHGFATSFGRAIAQGSEIAHRGTFAGPFIVFAWPAHGAFASWPRPSALVSRAYRDDSTSAAASAGAFRRALGDLLSAIPARRLTVVAHSLGAQLASEALVAPSPVRDLLQRAPLHALALFAPDIPAARFRDSLDATLAPLATRRVVYASKSDRLLTVSRLVNHSARVGQAGGERLLAASDVEMVDVTNGRRVASMLHRLIEPHHAMRYASSALRDFFGVVRGTPGACRTADAVAERLGERSWRLTSAPVPVDDLACGALDSAAHTPTPPR
jgi:esterase/lipase superfamily enzyme